MENLKITVKLFNPDQTILREVPKGTTLEELAKSVQHLAPYDILAARVHNTDRRLNHEIEEQGEITMLDMRDPSGNMIYQRSLSFLYLKACRDVLGKEVKVLISNSLNKGLYTEIRRKRPVNDDELKAISRRMEELVALDLPITKHVFPRHEAMRILEQDEHREKMRLLERWSEFTDITLYSLDGSYDYFYGPMVMSTGYIRHFEVRRCRSGVVIRFPDPKKPDRIPPYVDDVKLYEAFGESVKWCRLMGINFVEDLNEKVRDGSYKEVIQISEALHEKKIAQIADMITSQCKRIVLIAGPSSSGKTTFAHRLCIQLRVNGVTPLYLGTDDYFVERDQTPLDEKGEPNFEDIDAIDIDLFNENMNGLLAGEEVDLPTFDFREGKKIFGKRITKAKTGQPIVIEGIHGLNRKLTEQIPDEEKFKIYISPFTQINIDYQNRIPTTDARMLRRIVRDSQFRGYSAQHTIKLWPKVREGEDKNIFPFNGEADVLFNSVHIYELAVLKKYAQPLLESVKQDEPEFAQAQRMLRFLQYFDIIEDDSYIVNNSILREFVGGSIFVD